MKYCRKCNSQSSSDEKFCGRCGTLLEHMEQENYGGNTAPSQDESTGQGGSKKRRLFQFAFLGVVFVLGFVIAFITFGNNGVEPEPDPVVEVEDYPEEDEEVEEAEDNLVITPHIVVDDTTDELADYKDMLGRSPFDLDVWGESNVFQMESGSVVLDVPVPDGEIISRTESSFHVRAGAAYSVSGGLGVLNSSHEWYSSIIDMMESHDIMINFNYEMHVLDGLHLMTVEKEWDNNGITVFDNDYYLMFRYGDYIFHVTVTFSRGVEREEFYKAYGIYRFVEEGMIPPLLPIDNRVENHFDLSVWGDTNFIQVESGGVTVDIPIPPGDLQRHDEDSFFLTSPDYTISAGIGMFDSVMQGVESVIIHNAAHGFVSFEHETIELGDEILLIADAVRSREGEDIEAREYTLLTIMEGQVVHVSVSFGIGASEAERARFFEAYGLSRFWN